jgi:hypothetical protein
MPVEEIDYEAVLADLEERRSKIDAAIDAVKGIIASLGITPTGSSRVRGPQDISTDAFFNLNTGEAARKYLGMVKGAQSVSQVWEALKRGGLPDISYNAVYNALSRRENNPGDVVKLPDNTWGLAEWYGGGTAPKKRRTGGSKENGSDKTHSEASAPAPTPAAEPTPTGSGAVTQLDRCEAYLRDAKSPLHISKLVEKLAAVGETTKPDSLSSNLRKDKKQRFRNHGKNTWGLAEWPESVLNQGRKE